MATNRTAPRNLEPPLLNAERSGADVADQARLTHSGHSLGQAILDLKQVSADNLEPSLMNA
jgi:hypothetical protein